MQAASTALIGDFLKPFSSYGPGPQKLPYLIVEKLNILYVYILKEKMLNFIEWILYHKLLAETTVHEETDIVSLPPKILWLTGMASTGDGPKFLNNMGYDCKGMSTLTSRKAAYIGRFERYAWAKLFLQKQAEKLGKAHMAANVEKHNREIDEFEPELPVPEAFPVPPAPTVIV